MLMMPRSRNFSFFDKAELLRLKMKAMRSGVWFKALRRIDRLLVDLTIRVASKLRSVTLADSLVVRRKLQEFLESKLSRSVRSIGFPTAYKFQCICSEMG